MTCERTRREPKHIVDQLLDDRAGGLFDGRRGALKRRLLDWLLDYASAVALADRLAPLPGMAAMEAARDLLALDLHIDGLEHVPRRGPVLVVANHPTGIADAVAVFDLLARVRPDLAFFGNADALAIAPGLADLVIPVEWIASRRNLAKSRATLAATARACEAGKCIVIFPSGRIAHLTASGLRERPWQPTAVSLARRFGTPVLPLHIRARNSTMFYLFSALSRELRDITVFHELLGKRGKRIAMTLAAPIDPFAIPGDADTATRALGAYIEGGLRGRSMVCGASRRPALAHA